jgi:hypothetical protein
LGISSVIHIANFASSGTTPVIMSDSGNVLIAVDGTTTGGWAVDMTNLAFAPISDPAFLGATRVDYLDTFFVFNEPNTNIWYSSLSQPSFQMFTATPAGSILTASLLATGSGTLTNGTFSNVALSGGNGTGAIATVVVTNGTATSLQITTPGKDYQASDVLYADLSGTAISTFTTVAGSGYTNGYYYATPLTGGTGKNAAANLTVTSGTVSAVTLTNQGTGYVVGDVLTAGLTGGTGFQLTVTAVTGLNFSVSVDTVGGTAFSALDFVGKSTSPDPVAGVIAMKGEIWVIGTQTSEVWQNTGAAGFPFQILQGVVIPHGCIAPYSIATQDLSVYWLSQDKQGRCVVLRGHPYQGQRVSTYAIENEFSSYTTVSDAIGWTYQQNGHFFYVLTFPTANATWVYDEGMNAWHQRASIQNYANGTFVVDGGLYKVPYKCSMYCGGSIYVGDYAGNLWQLSTSAYTENGVAIPRIRSFPHLMNNSYRVSYQMFKADMETGTDDGTVTNDGTSSANPPTVQLRWSDNRGKTYNNYVPQSMGALGQYYTDIQWRRLGVARDRVFEVSWSTPTKTALNGAWIEFTAAGT